MIENAETPSSTLRTQSEMMAKMLYNLKYLNITSNENQSMSQANMIPIFMEDQKDHDDTFASRDMSLLLITSIEYRDATSTSVYSRDMTLVSMVNQSPSDNREMIHTSVDIRDAYVDGSENCNASTSD